MSSVVNSSSPISCIVSRASAISSGVIQSGSFPACLGSPPTNELASRTCPYLAPQVHSERAHPSFSYFGLSSRDVTGMNAVSFPA